MNTHQYTQGIVRVLLYSDIFLGTVQLKRTVNALIIILSNASSLLPSKCTSLVACIANHVCVYVCMYMYVCAHMYVCMYVCVGPGGEVVWVLG